MGLIAVGDIHGCARTLELLLNRLAPTSKDTLVFIGDYVDRGPDSSGVVNRLLHLRDEVPCIFLRGNHEQLLLDALFEEDERAMRLWLANGGRETLESYRGMIPKEHLLFFDETVLYADTPDFFFAHGGIPATQTIAQTLQHPDPDVLLWHREHLKADSFVWEKTVVCGHTPQPAPILRPSLIAIDTGCVFSHPDRGLLTAIRLPEREVVQVRNADL